MFGIERNGQSSLGYFSQYKPPPKEILEKKKETAKRVAKVVQHERQ